MKKNLIYYFLCLCMSIVVIGCGTKTSSEDLAESSSNIDSSSIATEESTIESIEETTQDPFEGIQAQIEASDVVGKKFSLKNGLNQVIDGEKVDFNISIYEDGTFKHSIYHKLLSNYEMEMGLWEIDGSELVLKQTEQMNGVGDKVYRFHMKEGNLIFKEEGSDSLKSEVVNGAIFVGELDENTIPADTYFLDADNVIELDDLVNRRYMYEGIGYGKFYIQIMEDGTFISSQGMSSEEMISGTWEIDSMEVSSGNIAVIVLKESNGECVNRFCMKHENLYFIEEKSSNFATYKVKNGEIFFGEDITEDTWGEDIFKENPFANIDEQIDVSNFVKRNYIYEAKGYEGYGYFEITIMESGLYYLSEGTLVIDNEASYETNYGTWDVNGSIITLTSNDGTIINHFYMRNGNLVFIEEESTQFWAVKTVKNGEVFYGYSWQ